MSPVPAVVVIGDANLDVVLRGDVRPRFGQAEQLLDAADITLGGSASLVAHGLGRLEVPVALVAAVGDDAFGAHALDLLRAAGVDVSHVVRRRGVPTGMSVVLSDDDRAILTYPGALASLRVGDLPGDWGEEWGEEWAGVRHVHVASPYLINALRPHLGAVLAGLRADGITVSLDTNDDPCREWRDLAGLVGNADVVLPNQDEVVRWARALRLDGADWQSCAEAITGLGPTVVVKSGRAGGSCHRGGRRATFAPPPTVDVVGTTGAGDSFDAGWIAGMVEGVDHRTALRWAVTAGALSTRHAGGAPAQPTRDELALALGRS